MLSDFGRLAKFSLSLTRRLGGPGGRRQAFLAYTFIYGSS